jgi:hypothetical protein
VVSTLAAAIYERSLDRTRDRVLARIKLPGGRTIDVAGNVDVPAPRVAPGGETGRAHVYVTPGRSGNQRPTVVLPASAGQPTRRWLSLTAVTVGLFLVALLAVTGVELLKGSTLTRNETGTSVGRVVDPVPAPRSTDATETRSPTTSDTAERTGTPETSTTGATTEATTTESVPIESDGTERPDSGTSETSVDSREDDGTDLGATPRVTPTPTPDSTGD